MLLAIPAPAQSVDDADYFRHLPVMDGSELAGIVSIRDLAKHRIDLHRRGLEALTAAVLDQGQPYQGWTLRHHP
ncbi:MAG: hypothetical protein JWP04_2159, partial [Belnapia sp.]|nr:hypothetical protein [Belnapia sp.]